VAAPRPFPENEFRLLRALQAVGAAYVPSSNFNPPMFAGAGIELFDLVLRMDGLGSFAEELKHCDQFQLGRQKIKVLSLERILASKVAANRAKDRLTPFPSSATPWPRPPP
jgi:hypothetical protein